VGKGGHDEALAKAGDSIAGYEGYGLAGLYKRSHRDFFNPGS
jgi:hypothetical protein